VGGKINRNKPLWSTLFSITGKGGNVTIKEDILEQWKHHFQKWAIPNFITEFDLERLTLVEMQNKVIEEQQLAIGKRIQTVTSLPFFNTGVRSPLLRELGMSSLLKMVLINAFADEWCDLFCGIFVMLCWMQKRLFDTVHHEILFNKILHDGINGDMWILFRNVYRDMSVKVKWKGATSNPILKFNTMHQKKGLNLILTRSLLVLYCTISQAYLVHVAQLGY
jgi:hypothetical protein